MTGALSKPACSSGAECTLRDNESLAMIPS